MNLFILNFHKNVLAVTLQKKKLNQRRLRGPHYAERRQCRIIVTASRWVTLVSADNVIWGLKTVVCGPPRLQNYILCMRC